MGQTSVALKLESQQHNLRLLEREWDISQALKVKPGRVKAIEYSETEYNFNILVLPLMGADLGKIHDRCGRPFSLRTSLLVLDQLLSRIQDLHREGLVHRDIKPHNCVLGRGRSGNVIHLIDYGIARRAVENRSSADEEPRPSDFSLLVGTTCFASISAFYGNGSFTPYSSRMAADDL